MLSSCSLRVCPSFCVFFPLYSFEQTGRFSWNSVGGHAIEHYVDAITYNSVTWMTNVRTSEVDIQLAPVTVRPQKSAHRQVFTRWQMFIRKLLQKNTSMTGDGKLKLAFYYMERTRELLQVDKWSFVHWKVTDISTSLTWLFSLPELSNMAIFWNFEVMLGQPLNYFVSNSIFMGSVIYL
jgi:hypothetical protein